MRRFHLMPWLSLLALGAAYAISPPALGEGAAAAVPAHSYSRPAEPNWLPRLAAQQDERAARGCCILELPERRCSFASLGYCRAKADQAQSNFSFHAGMPCRSLPQCR